MTPRPWVYLGFALLALVAAASLARPSAPASAQVAPPNPAGVTVGSLAVTGPTWNFDGDVQAGSGPWASVQIRNQECDRPYRPGPSPAGFINFFVPLGPL